MRTDSPDNLKRANLFRNTLIICLLTMLLLVSAYKGITWLKKPLETASYQDKKAVAAFSTVIASLRPEAIVQQRILDAASLAQISQCQPAQAEKLLGHLQSIENRLADMAGLQEESGRLGVGNYLLPQRLLVDGKLWATALQANKVSCADLQRGLSLLARNEAQALLELRWKIPAKTAQLENIEWASVPSTVFTQNSPWGGLPGCIFMGGYYLDNGKNGYCAMTNVANVANAANNTATGQSTGQFKPLKLKDAANPELAAALPDSLAHLLRDLDEVRFPTTALYRAITAKEQHGLNQHELEGHVRDIGWHSHLTFKLKSQAIAQQTARCYTGDKAACTALGLNKAEIAKLSGEFFEEAAVRMTGVAIIDVATGQIEALASAHTDCFAQQYDGPGRDSDCPALPRQPRYNPDMLLNHAVFTDVMPASTVKPILALGFLSTPGYSVNDAALTHELKTSDSKGFLNRLFCFDSGNSAACDRPAYVAQAAEQLGWNIHCAQGVQDKDCGFIDILFGRRGDERVVSQQGLQRPFGTRVLDGRLFANFNANQLTAVNASRLQDCRAQGWENCRGNTAGLVAEGWGQGNARATPLGVASMLARLGAAANGQSEQARPYFLQQLSDNQGKPLTLPGLQAGKPSPITTPGNLAQRLVNALRYGHKKGGGTAADACKAANIGNCEQIDWVAGKTGTPPFSDDERRLSQIIERCAKIPYGSQHPSMAACYQQIPYKWYAALFQSGQNGTKFDKAIAVLSERNWYAKGSRQGLVDAPGDHGSNRSAEIAFRIMHQLRSQQTPATKS